MKVKNGWLTVGKRTMEYLKFGSGEQALFLIPGLGDGLRTVKGLARVFSLQYRRLAKKRTVYVLSRVNELPEGYTTRSMAADLAAAMDVLGLDKVDLIGVSQGGMIAQWFAIDYPERLGRLVLTVTAARPNPMSLGCLERWLAFAEKGDYAGLTIDTAEVSYTEKTLKWMRLMNPLLTRIGRPKGFDRFRVQAISCLEHNAFDRLPEIRAETLILGAEEDQIVGAEGSRELDRQIPHSRLYLYKGYGHGVYYEKKKDWLERICAFLQI